jgi:hypothetical protein
MGLKGRLDRLQKTMQGKLSSFELADGTRYFFEPMQAHKAAFGYWSDSLRADYRREPRPEPPEVLRAVAGARDRGDALDAVEAGYSFLPVDREALVKRGEFLSRSLVAAEEDEDLDPGQDLSE